MSLEALPDELLACIISHLPSHADVACLSRQCRRLYHLCDMSTRSKYHQVKLVRISDLDFAFKTLCTILRTPRLAHYVKNLELKWSPSMESSRPLTHVLSMTPLERVVEPNDLGRLMHAIRLAGYDSPEARDKMLSILLRDPVTMDPRDPLLHFLAQSLAIYVDLGLSLIGITELPSP
ncbi:hypothetical protein AOR_1_2306174 [Paecilomyces variotii No. 5]|uniref:F-box domain-containing protein n=1 Tax=Byssochlamys spectabilis (strain No. 5 / NBRC 109023) TaxID=1356009 RepID=V5FAL9_BYSSN|nr:hypothetical protein AOR_1_2306174 [Paecilomyces variotii No. 5]